MTTLAAQVPDYLARLAHEVAAREKIPIDQVVALALSAQLAVWRVRDDVRTRAARGTPDGLKDFLAKAADSPPVPGDELP